MSDSVRQLLGMSGTVERSGEMQQPIIIKDRNYQRPFKTIRSIIEREPLQPFTIFSNTINHYNYQDY